MTNETKGKRKTSQAQEAKTAREKRRRPTAGAPQESPSKRERRKVPGARRKRATSAPASKSKCSSEGSVRRRRRRSKTSDPPTMVPRPVTDGGESVADDDPAPKKVQRKFDKRSIALYREFIEQAIKKGLKGMQEEFVAVRSYVPPGFSTESFTNNPAKNRYRDVLCLDSSRVKLESEAPEDEDYVHANYVHGPGRVNFICCQGPLDNTVGDFWRLVWQENCTLVVMLCGVFESNKPKCAEYWTRRNGERRQFGRFNIKNMYADAISLDKVQNEQITATQLIIQNTKTNEERRLLHYQWSNWPDKGAPSSGVAALHLVSKVAEQQDQTVLVHCSAGIGRTGTLVALHMCIERLRQHSSLDVAECYKLESENLQTLALSLDVRSRNLLNDLLSVQSALRITSQRQVLEALSAIVTGVSYVIEETKKVLSWLDRSPFDQLQRYANYRNRIMDLSLKLLKTTQGPTADMLTKAKDSRIYCQQLSFICDDIVKNLNDPMVLCTAFLDRAVIRRTNPGQELGLNLVTSYRGVHMVSEVKFHSPADVCGKIDAGDEIVQINGQTVVGWDLRKLVEELKNFKGPDIHLLLKRRPKDVRISVAATLAPRRHRLASPAATPIETSHTDKETQVTAVKLRRRSSSLHEPKTPAEIEKRSCEFDVLTNNEQDNFFDQESMPRRQRRATVSGGSPTFRRISVHLDRKSSVCPRPMSHWLQQNPQDQCEEEEDEPTNLLRRKKLTHGATGRYRMSYINERVVEPRKQSDTESDDDVFEAECASIDVLSEAEVSHLAPELRVQGDEWAVENAAHRLTVLSVDSDTSSVPDTEPTSTPVSATSEQSIDLDLLTTFAGLPLESQQKLEKIFGCTPTSTPPRKVSPSWSAGPATPTKKLSKDLTSEVALSPDDVVLKGVKPLLSARRRAPAPIMSIGSEQSVRQAEDSAALMLQQLVHTPCPCLDSFKLSGWVVHRAEHNKWSKRYLVLVGTTLYIFKKPDSEAAEGVLSLPGFIVCPATDHKSSKKNVFKIENSRHTLYVSCHSYDEMLRWVSELGLAAISQPAALPQGDYYVRSELDKLDSESPRRKNIFGTVPRVMSRETAPGSPFDIFRKPKNKGKLSRDNSVGSISLNSWHSEGETSSRNIIDPLKRTKKRRAIPPEFKA